MDNKALSYFILRFGLGLNLFFQGIMRFGGNWGDYRNWINFIFTNSILPDTFSYYAGAFLPPIYLSLGFLLMFGYKTRWILLLCSLLFLGLMLALSILHMWNMVGIQTLYLLISTTLLFLIEYDRWSLEEWIRRTSRRALS